MVSKEERNGKEWEHYSCQWWGVKEDGNEMYGQVKRRGAETDQKVRERRGWTKI